MAKATFKWLQLMSICMVATYKQSIIKKNQLYCYIATVEITWLQKGVATQYMEDINIVLLI